ncbi:potassium channel family protein [Bacillus sp. JJ722]|uniref:potassium channel family protein n=1 Tax=Bacillus sp. JJ722 TaxID=3122973 RepID=UPI002FFDB29E
MKKEEGGVRIIFHIVFRKIISLNNWLLAISSISLLLISTVVMKTLEPETFATYFDAFWWTMTTVTTVGYGDLYPVTVLGKIYAIFLFVFGIGLIGIVISKLIDSLSIFRKLREEGKLNFNGKDHIVIFGWSRKVKHAIEEILEHDKNIVIVLIAPLDKSPYDHHRVHYIQGDPSNPEILQKGKVAHSKSVIIFAEDAITDSKLADAYSLMSATAIEKYAGNLHITVEVLEERNIELFRHVSVDEFIVSDETISYLAVHAALSGGTTQLFNQLLSKSEGDDLFKIRPNVKWATYREAYISLAEQGIMLIGTEKQLNITNQLSKPISDQDTLFIICSKEAYIKLQQTNE